MALRDLFIISIILLSVLLLLLQLDTVNNWSVAQVETQSEKDLGLNLDLNGLWERIDDYPEEDIVYINQKGDEVIATFEPTGVCYEDPYNRIEGTEYAPTRLHFRGSLIDNTIQGEMPRCYIEDRTTKLNELHLTVSDDGKRLDGFFITPEGQQYPTESYVFVSEFIDEPSVQVNTDKSVYGTTEQVGLSGQVTNTVAENSELFIEMYGPDNKQVFSQYLPLSSDGSFTHSLDLSNRESPSGTYRVVASYEKASDEATFEYGISPNPMLPIIPQEAAIAGGIIAVTGGGAGLFLHKHGYLKGLSGKTGEDLAEKLDPESDIDSPIIEVRIECGLENPEMIRRESSKNGNMITGEITELEQKLNEGVNKILDSRKKLKIVQKDAEFIKWCKEAKENPNKLLSKISQDVIGKFLSSIEPHLQNLMLSKISVESDISITEDRPKEIKKNITFSLVPIQAYIEFVVYSNGLRVSSTKFVFTVNSYVKIKNLNIHLARVNLLYENTANGKSSTGKRIEIENLLIGLNIELSKLKIGLLEKAIEPPLEIGKKEAEIKNLLFFAG
jgi:hypothetical protein